MQTPVQIQFINMDSSEAVEQAIEKHAAKLEQMFPDIQSCRVRIEAPSKKKTKGGLFHTRIEIKLPGKEIAVNRNPDLHHSYTDAYVSIRDAFKSAQRQLEAQVKKIQGKVKLHEESGSTGKISSLYLDNDCGWITSSDGYEIYFHRNSLLSDNFDSLSVGMAVQYIEHEDSEELRASSVRVIGQ
ncbi:HPF/RaiA family ribosome-associated protein [Desulfopila aestuarii]|uniref:Ribosome-associated translation inhibitor RaiA n=1 Tax=Desulfopila aestuarii DSM 18488 TaxID=1121416 RepID=A0A1M7YJA7_9BACT|nr:HPF/RaiA family ribosome-associated protein [Desulfopila aestuarii]SHO52699.1 Ribosome-associated translation inhibitor RaiA [Desulfopila aestuarii DSM 18488]